MKTFLRWLCLWSVLFVCGCSSVVPVQLGVMRPARVSYHKVSPPLVVVCNSFIPDVSKDSRYIDETGKHFRMDFAGDSIPSYFTVSLATRLHESACFDSVQVVFPDSAYITGCKGVDIETSEMEYAYVVVNEVKPIATLRADAFDGVYCVSLTMALSTMMQCFVPGHLPVTEHVADTLSWYAYGDTPKEARLSMPPFEMCLEEALSELAGLAMERFVPHVESVERYLFVTAHPAMKDALKFWQSEQYVEASYLWEYVYEKAKDKGRKASAAANLALYYELQDDYEAALKYAESAYNLFIEAHGVAEAEYVANYCEDLRKRIADVSLLEMQWGG